MTRLPVVGSDNDTWGEILNDFLTIEHNTNGTLKSSGTLASKANDSAVVHNTGDESIAGAKTFASTIIAPDPTSSTHVATKFYVDNVAGSGSTPDADTITKGKVRLAGDLGGSGSIASAPVISDNAITTAKIAASAVTSAKIADGTIVDADISGSAAIAKSKLAALNLGDSDINTISQSKITGLTASLSGKQPLATDLTSIAGLVAANDDIIQRKSGAWINRTPAQFKTDLALAQGDVGLGNVTNTSDANKPVSTAQQTALDTKAAKGANSDITSLSGLTTALSLAQGGTGSTTKNFVDLSSSQSVGGVKTFSSLPVVPLTPLSATDAASKGYVDSVGSSGTPDADATTKGKLQLAGDLSGTASSPTVVNRVKTSSGGLEDVATVASAGSSTTLNLASGNIFDVTLTAAACTLTLSGATNGKACTMTTVFHQDATGSRTVTWPASVKWANAATPVLTTTASKTDIFSLVTVNGGTTWYGFVSGINF